MNIGYTGDSSITYSISKGEVIRKTFECDIYQDTICGIDISLKCGAIVNVAACYFATFNDTVEFYQGNPSYRYPKRKTSQ